MKTKTIVLFACERGFTSITVASGNGGDTEVIWTEDTTPCGGKRTCVGVTVEGETIRALRDVLNIRLAELAAAGRLEVSAK